MTTRGGDEDAGLAFARRLVPSVIAAMGGMKLADYLKTGPVDLDAKLQAAFVDGLIAERHPDLPRKTTDEIRRATLRIASSNDPDELSWVSMAVVRSTVSLTLWQTALEVALVEAGSELCTKANETACNHKHSGFQTRWLHFKENLGKLDQPALARVIEAHRNAEPRTRLRNHLLHGRPEAGDGILIRQTSLDDLVDPLTTLRDRVVEETLRAAFSDPNPGDTVAHAFFAGIGVPTSLIKELV